ncbi:MAG: Sulfate adenylyltransferase subunit 1 [Burkholderiaceae bacterium]|nr:MAG: Sulfate adenylyltransferase subunit 1 [Burkholderiaceae bacterium]
MASGLNDHKTALRFITCGSVDDGKSTLIGRLLVDSRAVLQDQLAGVQRNGPGGAAVDLALLTDGLIAEREQGITIDVAYRYFATARRKFIIGDAPGHEQYTRNMVTAASSADAAVVLVDATKLDWRSPRLQLLPQTRRHALLVSLLRVPSVVFAVNKLDAVADPKLAFDHIAAALRDFAGSARIALQAVVPISALEGWNVVERGAGSTLGSAWCGYEGASLLKILEQLPSADADATQPFALAVQWVERLAEKQPVSADTAQGRRVFWGRVAAGGVQPGQQVMVMPGGQTARVAQVLDHARRPRAILAGRSAGVVLDREIDVSRGDWLLAHESGDDGFTTADPSRTTLHGTVAWMDDEPLVAGRVYWALHGHRWVKARVRRIVHRLDVNTLAEEEADELAPNAIGRIELALQQPLAARPYAQSRSMGSLVLVDTASNRTAGALLVR